MKDKEFPKKVKVKYRRLIVFKSGFQLYPKEQRNAKRTK